MENNLPPMEFRFTVDVAGEETGVKHTGEFVYSRLTNKEKLISQQWSEAQYTPKDLPQKEEVQEDGSKKMVDQIDQVANLYRIFSSVRFGLKTCPEWFTNSDFGLELYDFNVVLEVFNKKTDKEVEWINKIKAKAEKVKTVVEKENE